ncbi:type VI secretion system accessory protein TagJ [Gallaecimonas mangrovi]|uniref:type VI secretion system accessory protein TagJ n=1 Tax=Gallaecimonas mangrovi TaxID=2291597 RepID=UPI000E209014|nr:type VI secretion system accessory protein TagJ [Gallaecimonas mangrovi]
MKGIIDALNAGLLDEAIDVAQQAVKDNPADLDLRAKLIELLCLDGQLQRADDSLASLVKREPQWIGGAANLRQLLRAQQARQAFHQGQLADDVVAAEGPALEALIALKSQLAAGNETAAYQAAALLEESRGGEGPLADVRDCDDSLGPYLECLGTDGKFYLWRFDEIAAIQFHPPTSPLETLWRRAQVSLNDEREGEVFIPLTYATAGDNRQKLGRETDWQQQGELVTGVGLKLFLVGEEALSLIELAATTAAEARHVG